MLLDKTVSVGYNSLCIGTLAEREREKRDFRTRFAQAPRARCDWFAPPFALPFAPDIRSHRRLHRTSVRTHKFNSPKFRTQFAPNSHSHPTNELPAGDVIIVGTARLDDLIPTHL